MNNRYVFIAPFSEMAEMAKEVVKDLNLNDWVIDIGNVEDGLQKAQYYENNGAQIIVSRAMTAKIISENVDVPVIDLGASPYDIVNGLVNAKNLGNKIGVIGVPDLIYECHTLGEPMGVQVIEIPIISPDQIEDKIRQSKEKGIEVVLGGLNEIQCAMAYGMKGILLHTGRNTIAMAMKKAIEMVDIRHNEKIRAQRLQSVLDHSYEGILSTDKDNKIIMMNRTARSMMKLEITPLGQPLKDAFPFITDDIVNPSIGTNMLGSIVTLGNDRIIINSRPITVDNEFNGMVMTLQYVKDIEMMESKARKEIALKGHVASVTFSDIIAKSKIMMEVIEKAKRYAVTDSSILITGETGVGKEMFAQSIHNGSKRRNGPFVAINCASIPDNLLESELFGYEEGSFTGARRNGKKGYFEIANNGTLFLDEIGEIPLNLQANLLRVLQEKQIMRVGSDRVTPVNVRIITATHCDLEKATSEGKFRLDLFYRINVLRLIIPPIREREEDLVPLCNALIQIKSQNMDVPPFEMSNDAIEIMRTYPWHGNVRELENVIERLCIMYCGTVLHAKELQNVLVEMDPSVTKTEVLNRGSIKLNEKELIIQTLSESNGNRSIAAKKLGISTTTLWRKIKQYQLAEF